MGHDTGRPRGWNDHHPRRACQIAAADPNAQHLAFRQCRVGQDPGADRPGGALLLHGVEPQHILCLTYTKAAASEMQNRLFRRLGEWAMKPDADLRKALLDLGESELSAHRLARARQLFARAIETPGGLRIQTIHSFCASLLRRFPLEAGRGARLSEMDDRSPPSCMRAEIVEEMADTLAPDAVRGLTAVHSGEDFTQFVDQIARNRASFDPAAARKEPGAAPLCRGLPAAL
jgi:ATP-dependent helicase/nuclease subunit A